MKKIVTYPILFIAAITLIVEEAIWEQISSILSKVSHFKFIVSIENWIAGLNRYILLPIFLLPCGTSFAIKLIGFYLISTGHFIDGLIIICAAEILGTAIMVRLFIVARPKLLTFSWFSYAYTKLNIAKEWAKNFIIQSEAWKNIKTFLSKTKRFVISQKRSLLSWRFVAARRFLRKP